MGETQPATPWEREIDQLMQQQMVTLELCEAEKTVRSGAAIICEQLPFIFLATPNILAGAKAEIGNFQPALLDPYTLWNADEIYLRSTAESRPAVTTAAAKAQLEPRKPSSDDRLIALCRKGDQQAWAELMDKYKNLIYSIPLKLGMYQDAADIFQSVCVDLLSELASTAGAARSAQVADAGLLPQVLGTPDQGETTGAIGG